MEWLYFTDYLTAGDELPEHALGELYWHVKQRMAALGYDVSDGIIDWAIENRVALFYFRPNTTGSTPGSPSDNSIGIDFLNYAAPGDIDAWRIAHGYIDASWSPTDYAALDQTAFDDILNTYFMAEIGLTLAEEKAICQDVRISRFAGWQFFNVIRAMVNYFDGLLFGIKIPGASELTGGYIKSVNYELGWSTVVDDWFSAVEDTYWDDIFIYTFRQESPEGDYFSISGVRYDVTLPVLALPDLADGLTNRVRLLAQASSSYAYSDGTEETTHPVMAMRCNWNDQVYTLSPVPDEMATLQLFDFTSVASMSEAHFKLTPVAWDGTATDLDPWHGTTLSTAQANFRPILLALYPAWLPFSP